MWKWLLAGLGILVVLCAAGGFFFTGTETGREYMSMFKTEPSATEVRVDSVERGSVVRVVSAPGTVEPKVKVQMSAQVVARIVALPFREGDQVKKGDVVCRLDSEDLAASLESAKASLRGEEARLDGLRADLGNAEAELARTRGLYETKDVSKAAMDDAESAYQRARASVKQSEHAIEIARANIVRAQKNLDYAVMTAPMDGTLINLNAEVGELVVIGTLNNAGSVIMEIADLSTMLVKAKVDESNIAPVKAGQKARLYMGAYPDRVFTGTVELVGLKKQIDKDGTGYFETEILVKQEKGDMLRSGLTANAEIEVETFSDVLKVPSQAVVDRRVDELPKALVDSSPNIDKTKIFARVVYKFENGKAKAIPVNIGSSDTTHTVVVAGLAEGDRIVTGPYKTLVSIHGEQDIKEQGAKPPADPSKTNPPVAEKTAAAGKS